MSAYWVGVSPRMTALRREVAELVSVVVMPSRHSVSSPYADPSGAA